MGKKITFLSALVGVSLGFAGLSVTGANAVDPVPSTSATPTPSGSVTAPTTAPSPSITASKPNPGTTISASPGPAQQRPGSPVDLRLGTYSKSAAEIRWQSPTFLGYPGVTKYRIEVTKPSPEYWGFAGEVTYKNTSFVIRNLDKSTVYLVRVFALNPFGTSDSSGTLRFVTAGDIAPGAPRNIQFLSAANNSIEVRWNSPIILGDPPVSKYKIEISSNDGIWRETSSVLSSSYKSKQTVNSVTSYLYSSLLTNLSSNTNYNVRIGSVSETLASSTLTSKFKTTNDQTPNVVENPRVVSAFLDKVQIKWDPPAGFASPNDSVSILQRNTAGALTTCGTSTRNAASMNCITSSQFLYAVASNRSGKSQTTDVAFDGIPWIQNLVAPRPVTRCAAEFPRTCTTSITVLRVNFKKKSSNNYTASSCLSEYVLMSGKNLQLVNKIKFGAQDLPFTFQQDGQLRVVLPKNSNEQKIGIFTANGEVEFPVSVTSCSL